MTLLGRLFGGSAPPASNSDADSQFGPAYSHNPVARRDMLRTVLRDTLQRHGIPEAWIAGEALDATSRQRGPGIHWRLLIKHWEPRLLMHSVALQRALTKRITSLDPTASVWLMGVSWQFALADDSACPPLPPANQWTAVLRSTVPAPAAAAVTSGAKADLEKLFAARDAAAQPDAQSHGNTQATYEPTQPAPL